MGEFKVNQEACSDISRKYASAISRTGLTMLMPLRVNTNLSISGQSSKDVSIIKQNLNICTREINQLYSDLIGLRNGIEAVRNESAEADRRVNIMFIFQPFAIESLLKKIIDRMKIMLGGKDDLIITITNNIVSKLKEWSDQTNNNQVEKSESEVETIVVILNPSDYDPNEIQEIPIVAPENVQPSDGYVETINNTSSPLTNSNTYNGYSVLSELKDEYCFNQKDYSKFISPNSGKNVGCTATAVAIAYSILHGTPLNPTDVPWSSNPSSVGVSDWSVHTNVLLAAGSYSASDAMNACYEQINNGVPVILRVKGGHSVTVVGVRDGADPNNLTMGDFLIVDPSGGAVKTLDSESWFGGIDTSWSLRVPK